MTVWEKALVNMEKGYSRVTSFAANLSGLAKSNIAVMRLRMQMDRVQRDISEQHRAIGARLMEQSSGGTLPQTFEVFFKQGEIVTALERLGQLEKEFSGIEEELSREAETIKANPRPSEGKNP